MKVKIPLGEKSKLVYTNTDSFLLEIDTKDVYADMVRDHVEWFDLSKNPYDVNVFKRLNLSVKEILAMMNPNQKRLSLMMNRIIYTTSCSIYLRFSRG